MKMKKIVSIAVVLAMVLSLAACNQNTGDSDGTGTGSGSAAATDTAEGTGESTGENTGESTEDVNIEDIPLGDLVDPFEGKTHSEISDALYEEVLGEFNTLLEEAKQCSNLSERFAKMAIAEAKMLETGVIIPSTTKGGRYAISRVAPGTVSPVLWGTDNERFHQVLVATEFIKSEDRTEMKEKYNELKGSGEYEAWAKQYLADKGYTLKDTYNLVYNTDPKTWDWINTYRSSDSEALVNLWDGLMEYDAEGVQQPALAESYTVSDDKLTYTFNIRKGVKWVDSQGRDLGVEVTAHDFVAGMQHIFDTSGTTFLSGLYFGIIKNAEAYSSGEITDFSEVGIKAVDDYTLEYTLEEPTPFFTSMFGYQTFSPLCRSFYESHGGKYGADFDPDAADYTYGTTPENVAYCGPYTVTNATEKNTIVFQANESYWNKDNINVKTITWLYNDGQDALKAYNDAVAGTIDGCSLTNSALPVAKEAGVFDQYHYISATDSTTFTVWTNLYRGIYNNYNDESAAVSSFNDEQKLRANLALQNQHFRLALAYGIDKASYNAQGVGEDVKLLSVRNSYIPGTFVTLDEDVTVDINGEATTFKAGSKYGDVLQAQITADGYPIKVYDPNADDGAGSSDGFDGWYNVENAKSELKKAMAELRANGVEITAENPIHLEYPYAQGSEYFENRANAFKQSIEASLDKLVVIDLLACDGENGWYDATYFFDSAEEGNYNVCDNGGWGPDYGDPQTYLNTMIPYGDMIKMIGLY